MANCHCPCPKPGHPAEPYHLPGYGGHVPTIKERSGATFSRLSHDIMEDPCVSLSPRPVLSMPSTYCPVGNGSTRCAVPIRPIIDCPCSSDQEATCCDNNRSPFVRCPPKRDTEIFRCCESVKANYAGHVPGFTFHSEGRTFTNATWGTKRYMQNCLYYNTFSMR